MFALQQGEEELEGTIIDFSDSGQNERFFAIVDVVRKQSVVVAVQKLEPVPQPGSDCESHGK